jgi:hypothetical protein
MPRSAVAAAIYKLGWYNLRFGHYLKDRALCVITRATGITLLQWSHIRWEVRIAYIRRIISPSSNNRCLPIARFRSQVPNRRWELAGPLGYNTC